VRHNINNLIEQLPQALRETPEARFLYEFGCVTTMDIVRLSYHPLELQGSSKDYGFGRAAMEERWQQGLSDARHALKARPWRQSRPSEVGARVFDFGLGPDHRAQTSLMPVRTAGKSH
jgi:NTE family protein